MGGVAEFVTGFLAKRKVADVRVACVTCVSSQGKDRSSTRRRARSVPAGGVIFENDSNKTSHHHILETPCQFQDPLQMNSGERKEGPLIHDYLENEARHRRQTKSDLRTDNYRRISNATFQTKYNILSGLYQNLCD